MTRDHEYVGVRTARSTTPTAAERARAASTAYPFRQFVAYEALIERRERRDPETVVDEYARANPGVDLDEPTTFAQWRGGPGLWDTAERPQGLYVP